MFKLMLGFFGGVSLFFGGLMLPLSLTGDMVEVWNARGKIVVPVYVTERCMPGVVVVYEGSWMDLDKK